uniref:Uncharacterized protein n=1 Tax=Anguilla anguilla TaxID=7936 RepID=A0A0E9RCN1_ANGAN
MWMRKGGLILVFDPLNFYYFLLIFLLMECGCFFNIRKWKCICFSSLSLCLSPLPLYLLSLA